MQYFNLSVAVGKNNHHKLGIIKIIVIIIHLLPKLNDATPVISVLDIHSV